jgi:diguanylate cyclase (GGDEF)-like protein
MDLFKSSNNSEQSRENLFQIFKDVPMGVAVYDPMGIYVFANEQYVPDSELRESLIGQSDVYYFEKLGINKDALKKRITNFNKVLNGKTTVTFTEKLPYINSDKVLYYKRTFKPVFSKKEPDKIEYIYSFGNNLSAAMMSQREIKYLSNHDQLTNLRNRYAFYSYLDNHLDLIKRGDSPYSAILSCDIDNFKMVNDSLGFHFGDMVLKEAASRLRLCLPGVDMIFRLGGNEFGIIISGIKDKYEPGRIAEKIISYLSAPYVIFGQSISYLTTSVGIVVIPRDGTDKESLLKNLNTAVHHAKGKGKNNYQYFSPRMNEAAANRTLIERNLKTLVEKQDYENQFKVVYQPIVARNGLGHDYSIVGSEALLRWHSPELGWISPETFIPIAEESNLIANIGDWVFNKACYDYKAYSSKVNRDLYVSINLSAKQLKASNVVRRITNTLNYLHLDPDKIQLELTETSYLDDHSTVLNNIEKISELGVGLAIDDFGTGFASLSYLHRIPATAIKIDKSFIQYLNTSDYHKELVKSIIILGQNLEKDIIAEGVEQLDELHTLNEYKCNKFQGYLFSRPTELKEFETLLQKETILSTVIE